MSTLRVATEPGDDGLVQRVAEEVRALMARKRVTQTQIAEYLGIPQSSVSARLRGAVPFRLPELEQLAVLFDVDASVLLGGASTRRYSDPNSPTVGDSYPALGLTA